MKITDNLLRVISHAFSNNTPMHFLIKAGVLDISTDTEFLKKSYNTIHFLNTLVNSATTSSERDFFAYLSNTTTFTSRITKEKSIDSTAITVKEFICANGLVYSDFLDYIYSKLVKYIPDTVTESHKVILKNSMERTYNALFKVVDLRDQHIQEYTLEDISNEISILKANSKELSNEVGNIKLTVDTIKENMSNIRKDIEVTTKTIKYNINNKNINTIEGISTINSIAADEILREIEQMKANLVREAIIKFIKELKNKIDTAIKSNDESQNYTNLNHSLDIMLSNIHVSENRSDEHLALVTKLDKIYDSLKSLLDAHKGDIALVDNSCDNLEKLLNNFDEYLK